MSKNVKRTGFTGRRKAAIFLVSLGPETAGPILRCMQDDDRDELMLEIAAVENVAPEVREAVLREFVADAEEQSFLTDGGVDFVKEALSQALGEDGMRLAMSRLTGQIQVRPFQFLQRADTSQIRNVLQTEHPQTIALVLAHLSPDTASQILTGLDTELRTDVAMRVALMDRTMPETVHEIERVLERRLATSIGNQSFTSLGGVRALVDMLNKVDRASEKAIIGHLEEQNQELADEVRNLMFVFEDILTLDDRAIQRILRDADNKDVTLALKGSADEVKEKVLKNMSERAGLQIREELEFMGAVKRVDVEAAQQKVVAIIRRLEEAGEIMLGRGDEDSMVL